MSEKIDLENVEPMPEKPKRVKRTLNPMDRLVDSFMALMTREVRKRGKPMGYVKATTAAKWLNYALNHPLEMEDKLQYALASNTHRGNTAAFTKTLGASVYGKIVADWKEENKATIAEILLLRRNS